MKRCIGISGDTIQICGKILFVNGKMFKEPSTVKFDNVNRPKEFVNPRMFPKGVNWNEDWYGPIVVPKRSDKIN